MTEVSEAKKQRSVTADVLSVLKDAVQVSRPGWWVVSGWLYLAPTGIRQNIEADDGAETTIVGATPSFRTLMFWLGLAFVCLPLNIVTYGMNDYADAEIDVENPRKGNWLFGPRRMAQKRLKTVIAIGVASSVVSLIGFVFEENLRIALEPVLSTSVLGSDRLGVRSRPGIWKVRLPCYLVWYALGMLANISYNFKCLGHLSSQGPYETPVVLLGFSLVTVFSYWVNVMPHNYKDLIASVPSGHLADASYESYWRLIFGMRTSGHYFGCNVRYWIHLVFLVLRTQLWTEYLDFDNDATSRRTTTLVRLGTTKSLAKSIVLAVLSLEVLWNGYIYSNRSQWLVPFAFAAAGPFLFLLMDMALKKMAQRDPIGLKALLSLVILQTIGGAALMLDTWWQGLFVN